MTAWIFRLHQHDERALHALVLRRRPRLDAAVRLVTHLGDAAVTVGITLALMLSAVPRAAATGRRAAFALVASHLVVQLVKRTVTRARPRMPTGVLALVNPPDRFSFPSGHAASSLSVALPLALAAGGIVGAAMVAVATVVGLSRCYLGVHYPGDVLAGWLLALLGTAAAGMILV
jgi:undecaprenyl-diphosphatase